MQIAKRLYSAPPREETPGLPETQRNLLIPLVRFFGVHFGRTPKRVHTIVSAACKPLRAELELHPLRRVKHLGEKIF